MSIHDDVRRWRDPDHWRSLTALSLTAEGQSGPVQLAAGAGDKTLADLKTEGWFQLPRPYGDDAVERLKQGILDLHNLYLHNLHLHNLHNLHKSCAILLIDFFTIQNVKFVTNTTTNYIRIFVL